MDTRADVSKDNPKHDPKARVLSSWKEIAAYLGRGVRTVQRYERSFDLPVRRPNSKSRGAVYAFSEDLDEWLRTRSSDAIPAKDFPKLKKGDDLRLRYSSVRDAHYQAMATLLANLSNMMEKLKPIAQIGTSNQARRTG